MELGGKHPLIVFDDSDLENAGARRDAGQFYSTGQVCSNGTRVFVQRAEGPVPRPVVARTKAIKRRPADPETQVAALVPSGSASKVLAYIALVGRRARANSRRRGVPSEAAPSRAALSCARRFSDGRDDMPIAREEIFGPVMSRAGFDDEEEVIAAPTIRVRPRGRSSRATSSAPTAWRRSCEAGTCWINAYNLTPVELPFGGVKRFGRRPRELAGRDRTLHAGEVGLRGDGRRRLALLSGRARPSGPIGRNPGTKKPPEFPRGGVPIVRSREIPSPVHPWSDNSPAS